jgi:VanZ family protein
MPDSQALQHSAFARNLLLMYLVLIVYASLTPFTGWRTPEEGMFRFLWAPLPKYITRSDLLINFAAYLPFGFLLTAYGRQHLSLGGALVAGVAGTVLLSATMETLQSLLPDRIASNLDLATNGLGGAAGAVVAAVFGRYTSGEDRMQRFRDRYFLRGRAVDTGMALLAVWLISQLNPSIPFLAAGLVSNPLTEPWDAEHASALFWAPQAAGVAFNFCGVGLFVSALMQRRMPAFVFALALAIAAFLLKLLAAEAMLKPAVAGDWLGAGALIGIGGGLVLLAALVSFGSKARSYLAAVFILAGAIMSKIAASYASLTSILKIFDWPYGQLLNFTGLTLYLNELWPIVALVFLVFYFARRKVQLQ